MCHRESSPSRPGSRQCSTTEPQAHQVFNQLRNPIPFSIKIATQIAWWKNAKSFLLDTPDFRQLNLIIVSFQFTHLIVVTIHFIVSLYLVNTCLITLYKTTLTLHKWVCFENEGRFKHIPGRLQSWSMSSKLIGNHRSLKIQSMFGTIFGTKMCNKEIRVSYFLINIDKMRTQKS